MPNFYDEWLALWDKNVSERRKSRKVIYPEELQWVGTRQDFRAALLVAPETGFRTLGGVTMVAEIPPRWKTGKHSHGEEAMYILKGKGFSVINEQRFDWEEGSCIRIPFGATHQHFNISNDPVQYYAALAPHLEYFCSVSKFEHKEDCGELTANQLKKLEGTTANETHDSKGRRIVLPRSEAATTKGGEIKRSWIDKAPEVPQQMRKTQANRGVSLMGAYEDFRSDEVEITDIFIHEPGHVSVKHAHMEAVLYVLRGEGYMVIDGEKFRVKPGTAMHIQGPQTVHQHFNDTRAEAELMRTHFGIRKYIQPIARETFPYVYLEEGRNLKF